MKTFKDKSTAIARTEKMLRQMDEALTAEEQAAEAEIKPNGAKAPKKAAKSKKAPKKAMDIGEAPKIRADVAENRPRVIQRLTRRLCAKIRKLRTPLPGERLRWWGDYENGMTLRHVAETNGLSEAKVSYWARIGCLEYVMPSDEEYAKQLELFQNES